MTIEKFYLKNWRSIGKEGISLDLGRINVLSGVNDAGKTSVLLAFYSVLYNANSEYPNSYLDKHLHAKGSLHFDGNDSNKPYLEIISTFSELTFKELIENIVTEKIQIELALGRKLYNENMNIIKFKDEIMKKVKIKYSTQEMTPEYEEKWEVFCEFDNTPFLNNLKINIEKERTLIKVDCFFISTNRIYNIKEPINENDSLIINESKIDRQIYNITKLDNELSDMVNFIKKIKNEKNRNKGVYTKLLNYIKIIFPEVVRLDVNTPDGSVAEDIFVEWNINGIEKSQPLSRSGNGVFSVIYLAGRLLNDIKSDLTTIAFIDEPETGLHPKLQVRFLKLLRQLSEDFNVQWMLSTHSPFIMKNLKEEDRLFLLEHNGIESTVKNINPADKSIVFQAIGAYLPDTLTANGIIFVEGATESTILPIMLERLDIDIDQKGIVIMPLGGDNLYSIKPQELVKINSNVMVILDSDLVKPLSEGGNIISKKLEYENECISSDIKIVMPRNYRTIENMYPQSVLAQILDVPLEELNYGDFDKVDCIPDTSKVKIGIKVAEQITENEIKNFPLIKEILDWLD
ncbi:AAA family ATPase [Paenibacillus kyungheensis]|uniref:AAA family ATPase n=1 Tax=Paenibacillus kyungheensis TaxID=1452732 RepID=A0AAX3M8Z8_9BACL|nr:AAA family ATPase [Paenibacillus kyungheensis]WCT57823.1 AAA family ATPase [Paenibacillus kyungheensis]